MAFHSGHNGAISLQMPLPICSNRSGQRAKMEVQAHPLAVDLGNGRVGRTGRHARAPATAALCNRCVGAAAPAVAAARVSAIAYATCNRVRSNRTSAPASAPPTMMCPTMGPYTSGRRITIMSSLVLLHAGEFGLITTLQIIYVKNYYYY